MEADRDDVFALIRTALHAPPPSRSTLFDDGRRGKTIAGPNKRQIYREAAHHWSHLVSAGTFQALPAKMVWGTPA